MKEIVEGVNDKQSVSIYEFENPEQILAPKEKFSSDWWSYILTLDHTDLGNVQRVLAFLNEKLIFTKALGWFVWNGEHWEQDSKTTPILKQIVGKAFKEIFDKALPFYEVFYEDAKDDKEETKRITAKIAFYRKNTNITAIRNVIQLMEGYFLTNEEKLDIHPDIINMKNGTLDLRTLKLHPHDPTNYITKTTKLNWNPEAKCPQFKEFLIAAMSGDKDQAKFLAMMMGYFLSGEDSEQMVYFFCGKGLNGKSTFCEICHLILGTYAKHSNIETFLVRKSSAGQARGDLARLNGARFITASEPRPGECLDESTIKQLTGGEPFVARGLYAADLEIWPTFKVAISFNNEPKIRGQDEGIWRRITRIAWNQTFEKNEDFKRILKEEKEGIFTLAARCCQKFYEKKKLTTPESVLAETKDYRISQDTTGRFIEECLVIDKEGTCEKKKLYKCYREWCKDVGEDSKTQNSLGRELKSRFGFKTSHTIGARTWKGVAIFGATILVENDDEKEY